MPSTEIKISAWVALLVGLFAGYTLGGLEAKHEGSLNPLLIGLLWQLALPGIFLIFVGVFLAGCYGLDWLWTRAIWLWVRHKHQVEIREHLRASGRASERQ